MAVSSGNGVREGLKIRRQKAWARQQSSLCASIQPVMEMRNAQDRNGTFFLLESSIEQQFPEAATDVRINA